MDKIQFKDLQAEHLNRYQLTPVTEETDTYDITPVRGAVTQSGTPVRALELNQMQENVESGIFKSSAAITPTIGGDATTRLLTAPNGSNPNRMTLLLTSATTATSAINLRIGTGTAYPIVMPSGGTTDYIKSLSAWVPYDLVLANVGGTLVWVCLNPDPVEESLNVTVAAEKSGTLYLIRRGDLVSIYSGWISLGNNTSDQQIGTISNTKFRPYIYTASIPVFDTDLGNKAAAMLRVHPTGDIILLAKSRTNASGWVTSNLYIGQ